MSRSKFLILVSLVWVLVIIPLGIGQPAAQVLQVGPNGYLIPNYFGTTANWAFSPVPAPTAGTPVTIGNPVIERAYATDNAAEVLVVVPTPLPDGQVQGIQTLNQATAGGSVAPSAGYSFHAYILRPTVNPNEYTVVFDSGLLTVPALADPAVSEITTFPVPNIPVLAGDLLAFYGQGIPLDIGAGADFIGYPAPVAPAQGNVITLGSAGFPILAQARTYSIAAAVIGPTTLSGGLRKFVDPLPGLYDPRSGSPAPAKCIPLAVPDTITYPGTDYYEIELRQYTESMHSDLPNPTTLRGYVQVNNGTDAAGANTIVPAPIRYLGPLIIAQKDRPVRIKFTNKLPTGDAGKLFIPVDKTIEGSGPGYNTPQTLRAGTQDHVICANNPSLCYTENRADLHLHGGRTPWISDGTPHQWIVPFGESTVYTEGVSKENVPDMEDPGLNSGSQTYYWTNQQSARLLFYHDHAWGITRLNVYAGEAAGYLITDQTEQQLMGAGGPLEGLSYGTPLVIQDKTFVDAATIGGVDAAGLAYGTDPTWAWGTGTPVTINTPTGPYTYRTPVTGDLWVPHVYVPAQNPYNPDFTGVNPMGRWPWAYWFMPQPPICGTNANAVPPFCIEFGAVANPYNGPDSPSPLMPDLPNPSWTAEAFHDTPLVNGIAYPTHTVPAGKVRFRILNAANDRFWNLQLYVADPLAPTEVKMVPAAITPGFPELWPMDGREGGVPDPATRGPAMIQIGTEGGFLPAPVVLPNQPIQWITDPTLFMAGLVMQQNEGGGTLFLGPAERADVVIDFTPFAGKTLILYNDAPAPWPALDPHYDYYTGAPDNTGMGGAPTTIAGYGPNTRTIMQIKVSGTDSGLPGPVDYYDPAFLTALQGAFTPAVGAGVFAESQDPIVVGQTAYDLNYHTVFPALAPNWGISTIFDTSLSFQTVNPDLTIGAPQTIPMQPKAIQDEQSETYDKYGRLSAKLGIERGAAAGAAGFVVQNYVDPATEILNENEIQVWKITHNGVDTHPVHFHLFDVQVINRVGWDGFIFLIDENERGWKDTVRISPLQDTIVALRPITPAQPFGLPYSVRPLNPAQPIDSADGFTNLDPFTGQRFNPPVTNQLVNFGWEYVWHCHILAHEEMDMMRPIKFNVGAVLPAAPALSITGDPATGFILSWTDGTPFDYTTWLPVSTIGNPANEIGFRIERDTGPIGVFEAIAMARPNTTTFTDDTTVTGETYLYRVVAFNAAGDSPSNPVTVPVPTGPALTLFPTGLVFSSPLGIPSAAQTVTATNTGGAPLRINSINESGTNPNQFTTSNIDCPIWPATLAAGASCTIEVIFAPTAASPLTKNAFLNVNVAAPAASQSVSLTGTIDVPTFTLSPNPVLLSSPLNITSPPQAVTLANTGTAPLRITGINDSGTNANQFLPTNVDCPISPNTLAAGGSCTINVTFTPTQASPLTKNALLNVNVGAPAASQSVPMRGTVVVPLFTLSPASLAFGSQVVSAGPTAARAVTVANVGEAPLRITSISRSGANPGQFAHTNVDCPINGAGLAAGASCTINVTFDPSSPGLKNAFLNVNVGAPATSQRIPLSGTGIR